MNTDPVAWSREQLRLAGLGDLALVDSSCSPDSFGNWHATYRLGSASLMLLNDRGSVEVALSPATGEARMFAVEEILAVAGMAGVQHGNAAEADGAAGDHVLALLKAVAQNQDAIQALFSAGRLEDTIRRLDKAARERFFARHPRPDMPRSR